MTHKSLLNRSKIALKLSRIKIVPKIFQVHFRFKVLGAFQVHFKFKFFISLQQQDFFFKVLKSRKKHPTPSTENCLRPLVKSRKFFRRSFGNKSDIPAGAKYAFSSLKIAAVFVQSAGGQNIHSRGPRDILIMKVDAFLEYFSRYFGAFLKQFLSQFEVIFEAMFEQFLSYFEAIFEAILQQI